MPSTVTGTLGDTKVNKRGRGRELTCHPGHSRKRTKNKGGQALNVQHVGSGPDVRGDVPGLLVGGGGAVGRASSV